MSETPSADSVPASPVPLIIESALSQSELSVVTKKSILELFSKVEDESPGLTYHLVDSIIRKENIQSTVDCILLLSWCRDPSDGLAGKTEREFVQFNDKLKGFKVCLSKFPSSCSDKTAFFKMVKEIAVYIKELVEEGSKINEKYFTTDKNKEYKKTILTSRREFIKYSKNFSASVKDVLKDPKPEPLYIWLNNLINQLIIMVGVYKEIS